jgi:hypothetical protein
MSSIKGPTVADLIAKLQQFDPMMRVARYYHSGYSAELPSIAIEQLLDHGGYLETAWQDKDKAKAGDWLVIG